jgi:23S rRNA (adenine2503-C2)-methyltransferase
MDLELLTSTLQELGEPAYRERQVWRWAAQGAGGFAEMTNLPLELRAAMARRCPTRASTLVEEAHASDGTVKALFETGDGRPVRRCLCAIATAAHACAVLGCPLTCTFCATGQMRFGRNLRVGDPRSGAAFPSYRRVDHAVFMGMGEPMMNLDAVLGACAAPAALEVGHRHVCGVDRRLDPGIERLAAQPMPIRLALSLHAADDAALELMPVTTATPGRRPGRLSRLLRAQAADGIRGVRDAGRGQRLLCAGSPARRGLDPRTFKVNLIPTTPPTRRCTPAPRRSRRFVPSSSATASVRRCASPAGATSPPRAVSSRRRHS